MNDTKNDIKELRIYSGNMKSKTIFSKSELKDLGLELKEDNPEKLDKEEHIFGVEIVEKSAENMILGKSLCGKHNKENFNINQQTHRFVPVSHLVNFIKRNLASGYCSECESEFQKNIDEHKSEEYYICQICGLAKAITEPICVCQHESAKAKMISKNEKK